MQQQQLDASQRVQLWDLINRSSHTNPQMYHAQWRPYLRAFPHHFIHPLGHLHTVEALERAAHRVPHGRFALTLKRGLNGCSIDALVRSRAARNVASLTCTGARLAPEELERLARCDDLCHLTSLDLSGQHLGEDGVRLLVESTWLPNLTSLDLSACAIGNYGVQVLMRYTRLNALQTLNLSRNAINSTGASMLAEGSSLRGLKTLNISNNYLRNTGLKFIVESPYLDTLHTLSVAGCCIENRGAEFVASASHSPLLQALDLSNNWIQTAGAMRLAASTKLTSLRHLNLGTNRLGDDGVTALLYSHHLTQLQHLDVQDNGLSVLKRPAQGAQSVAPLLTFNVSKNQLGAGALDALWRTNLPYTLTALNASYNSLTDDDARAMAYASWRDLKHMDLTSNSIRSEGAHALSSAPWLYMLDTLNVDDNPMGHDGTRALIRSPYLRKTIAQRMLRRHPSATLYLRDKKSGGR